MLHLRMQVLELIESLTNDKRKCYVTQIDNLPYDILEIEDDYPVIMYGSDFQEIVKGLLSDKPNKSIRLITHMGWIVYVSLKSSKYYRQNVQGETVCIDLDFEILRKPFYFITFSKIKDSVEILYNAGCRMETVMETQRLEIRRFTPDDWQDLYDYLSDKEVVRFEPYSVFNEEQAIKETERRANDDSFWAVCLKDSNKLIGNLYFCQQEPKQFMTWEIGYVFNRAYSGKGYATESADRLLQYGFEICNAHRIQAHCNPQNISSWRLLERLHMRREGHFIQKAYFNCDEQGKPLWHDAYEYAILSDEWFERSK